MSERLQELYDEMQDKDKRIAELQAEVERLRDWDKVWRKRVDAAERKLERVRELPEKWHNKLSDGQAGGFGFCAYELQAALEE